MRLTAAPDPEKELFERGREVLGKQVVASLPSSEIQEGKTSRWPELRSSRHQQNPMRANTSAGS
jgi:hypothetical protein